MEPITLSSLYLYTVPSQCIMCNLLDNNTFSYKWNKYYFRFLFPFHRISNHQHQRFEVGDLDFGIRYHRIVLRRMRWIECLAHICLLFFFYVVGIQTPMPLQWRCWMLLEDTFFSLSYRQELFNLMLRSNFVSFKFRIQYIPHTEHRLMRCAIQMEIFFIRFIYLIRFVDFSTHGIQVAV